jgi:uncharacterized protein YnzC (UPF0291/DUF896 family)
MSKLSKFIGESIEVEIRGEKLKLYPLPMKATLIIEKISDLSKKEKDGTISEDEKVELVRLGGALIKISFREENLSDDELENMDLDLYAELYAAVMDNALTQKDGKGLRRIRELKEKASEQEQAK